MNVFLDSCLQKKLDHWCEHLGIDDNIIIPTEHPDCNNRKFARLDGSTWRCFAYLTDNEIKACVSDTGELTGCHAGDNSNSPYGEYCTRDNEIRTSIAEGCQDESNFTLINFVSGCYNVTMLQLFV